MEKLDQPATPRKLKVVFGFILAALVVFDLLIIEHHNHHWLSSIPGFYAWYVFFVGVALILIAKFVISPRLVREDTYYDDE